MPLSTENLEKLTRADVYMDEIMKQLGVNTPAEALVEVAKNKAVADMVRRTART